MRRRPTLAEECCSVFLLSLLGDLLSNILTSFRFPGSSGPKFPDLFPLLLPPFALLLLSSFSPFTPFLFSSLPPFLPSSLPPSLPSSLPIEFPSDEPSPGCVGGLWRPARVTSLRPSVSPRDRNIRGPPPCLAYGKLSMRAGLAPLHTLIMPSHAQMSRLFKTACYLKFLNCPDKSELPCSCGQVGFLN